MRAAKGCSAYSWIGGFDRRSAQMATHIVMDDTGDTRHDFDASDMAAIAKAEERFNQLISGGFTAAVRDAAGDVWVTRSFDPTASETLYSTRGSPGAIHLAFVHQIGTAVFHSRWQRPACPIVQT
jgi:hypothetical protein